jgi:Tol biopolymer transport system component
MLALAAGSADAAFPGQNGKIGFVKENFRNGSSGIFAINPDGSGQERLGPQYGYSPSWSADGQKVVLVASSGEGEMEYSEGIYVMNADGTGRGDLTASQAYDASPAFSPSGNKIIFSTMTLDERSEKSDLVVMRADGANKRQITDTPAGVRVRGRLATASFSVMAAP